MASWATRATRRTKKRDSLHAVHGNGYLSSQTVPRHRVWGRFYELKLLLDDMIGSSGDRFFDHDTLTYSVAFNVAWLTA
ncbi:hypothetical protein MUBE_12030 [Mycobacterium uberis]|uniref:Uncharacterized protein n=1 Tax=Mycobacterium uberis TaxID=2162698 RepID=A0A3E1HE80_9MYCO|nr:hypothetical protein [Mycobacterium uberis]RFD24760.1 hypothetical protein MUBE_12030 [Mycobacterium uberis]